MRLGKFLARKVFKRFNKLSSPVAVVGTPNEDFRVPIPYKLAGIHDVWENNSSWICPESPFDEISVPKRDHKGSSKTHLKTIPFIVEKTPIVDPNASFIITCSQFSAPSSKALKKSTLGR
jgi:hypothetical protein